MSRIIGSATSLEQAKRVTYGSSFILRGAMSSYCLLTLEHYRHHDADAHLDRHLGIAIGVERNHCGGIVRVVYTIARNNSSDV